MREHLEIIPMIAIMIISLTNIYFNFKLRPEKKIRCDRCFNMFNPDKEQNLNIKGKNENDEVIEEKNYCGKCTEKYLDEWREKLRQSKGERHG